MTMTMDQMSARYATDEMKEAAKKVPQFIVSSDGHIDEPLDLFDELPEEIRKKINRPKLMLENRPKGGTDPVVRIKDMELDGLAAEVLYPTFSLALFSQEQDVQEAAFRVYNDWIADYCKHNPNRLFAIPCLSVYNIDNAIKEMHRCADMGLLGGLVWQVPREDMPLISDHYEKLWAAAAELGQPIHFHILTGFNYFRFKRTGIEKVRGSVNHKTNEIVNTALRPGVVRHLRAPPQAQGGDRRGRDRLGAVHPAAVGLLLQPQHQAGSPEHGFPDPSPAERDLQRACLAHLHGRLRRRPGAQVLGRTSAACGRATTRTRT